MKKLFLMMLALLVLLGGTAPAETGVANPWSQTTAQGLMDALGLQLGLPDGATNVAWQMMEAEQMGQVTFTWQGEDYTARIAPADVFEDISGLYYEWEAEDKCEVGRCKGVVRRAHDGENTVDVWLWYDDPTGLMYSVSVMVADLDGFDITAAANILYIPMQTE
jgi:hypothetical protein